VIAAFEADAFAVAMLGVIFLSFGVIGLLLWCMKRNVARRNVHVDALLEELEAQEAEAEPVGAKGSSPQAWEKDADWWK
jgi:hypothetical protein